MKYRIDVLVRSLSLLGKYSPKILIKHVMKYILDIFDFEFNENENRFLISFNNIRKSLKNF